MEVELLSVTPDALNLLLRTKGTRLAHTDDPAAWSVERRAEHLAYMRDTIRSSWEFCDYTFRISGVSRAFTHQLVRTRTGSYAQESQRTVDVREARIIKPASIAESGDASEWWEEVAREIRAAYAGMIDNGIPVQDARGILPTAVSTSIIAKFNLRTLSDMAKLRLCARTQGEYQAVFRRMRELVIVVHPWVEEHRFLEVHCVAEGTCAFPRYGKAECKFYDPRLDRAEVSADIRRRFWMEEKAVAVPVAKDGKTM